MNKVYKTYRISRITKPYIKKLNFTNRSIQIKTRSHFLLVGLAKAGQVQGRCSCGEAPRTTGGLAPGTARWAPWEGLPSYRMRLTL